MPVPISSSMLNRRDTCWVITDGAAGNRHQAMALARQMGWPLRRLTVTPRPPWSWLAPRRFPGEGCALPKWQRAAFVPPWPDLAIGCGRKAALFTRRLRQLSEGRCHCVQILDPRMDSCYWDTVIAPCHDHLTGVNVLRTLGSLNPIDDDYLADARRTWPGLGLLAKPRIGVLLGGPRRGVAIDMDYARALAGYLRQCWHHEGGSVLVVASPRTPMAVMHTLRHALTDIPGLHWSSVADGPNPYAGVLGWTSRFIVTPDSVNMLSEACATGSVVQTLIRAPLPSRLARFHRALREIGLLHEPGSTPSPPLRPLRETVRVATQLRQRMQHP